MAGGVHLHTHILGDKKCRFNSHTAHIRVGFARYADLITSIFYRTPLLTSSFSDRFGRALTYLRISVTDRCNMRCDYCRPDTTAFKAEPHSQILRYEEIERIARIAAELGVTKLRITGGEPLVRHNLSTLVAQLAAIPGITPIKLNCVLMRGINDSEKRSMIAIGG